MFFVIVVVAVVVVVVTNSKCVSFLTGIVVLRRTQALSLS